MTAANLRLRFFPLSTKISNNLKINKCLFFSAKFISSFPKIYYSRRRSSGRITSPPVDLGIDKLEVDDCSVNHNRWKSVAKRMAKRKVAMRVGYVGTSYKGLQIQRDSASTITIEGELERAILKAGGMLERNYGNLHKIGWRRSSRTDKGGNHPFHNYTIRAQYRKHLSKTLVKVSRPNFSVEEGSNLESKDCKRKHGSSTNDDNNLEEEISNLTDSSDTEEDLMNSIQDIECESNMSSAPEVSKFPRAKWLHERDEADLISAAHFRKILSCTCGDLEAIANVRYIEISIHGESFMFHQIRKMVGTAVAVKRGLLPKDIMKISLLRPSRIVLPLAPSEVLVLSGNEFYIPEKFRSRGIPSNSVSGMSEISRLTGSASIQDRVDDFYSTVLLPELAVYLDPLKPLWKGWLERLDRSAIPDVEMNELRRAWIQWQENHVSRKQEVS